MEMTTIRPTRPLESQAAQSGYASAPENSAVTSQPHNGGYEVINQSVSLETPSGLEPLLELDQLIVKQRMDLSEVYCGCEMSSIYDVKDSHGRDLFVAEEETDCFTRNVCGSSRPFDLKVKDLSDREVFRFSRSLACGSGCFPCYLQEIAVYSPPGQLVGTVEQEWSLCAPDFIVKDSFGYPVLKIQGPLCKFSLCGGVEFRVVSLDGEVQVGKISKNWSGLFREAFTDADNFGISFPADLDVKMKAVMLGACFLIDFMFFETSK